MFGLNARTVPAVIGVAAVIVGSMGVGASLAAIPSHGVVHTCYARKGGALRVVAKAGDCTKQEKALALDQRGPRGARGPSGASSILWAQVRANGTVDSANTKVSATDEGPGDYLVTFTRNVGACHYWAEAGANAGLSPTAGIAASVVYSWPKNADQIDVGFATPGGSETNTQFTVYVLC
jgi:hypothetical protein